MNPFARPIPFRLLVLADVALAVPLALASVAGQLSLTTVAAALFCALPVAVRRFRPVPAYCAALLFAALTPVLRANAVLMVAVVALTLYTVSATHPVRRSLAALVPGLLVTGAALLILLSDVPPRADGWPDPVVIVGTAWLVVAATWSLGAAARTRREYAAREARRQAEQAVADERMRIVRELHDVLAHSMSMITVRAGVAAKVLDKHPEEGRRALLAIEETGRASLVEIRQFLGALRAPGGAPENAPLPGLADLPALAEKAAEAGVRVDLSVNGTVPGHMGLSVYRIVQEAITNVVRHAAPAHCRVDVSAADGMLRISVVDDGPGRRSLPGATSGHGLAGMRERTLLYGGSFEAGPLPGGGFSVSASWEIP